MVARAVVFDLDGTLVETAPDLHAVLAAQLTDRGFAAPPLEAVRAYHAALKEKNIPSVRSLEDDSAVTEAVLRRGTGSPPEGSRRRSWPCRDRSLDGLRTRPRGDSAGSAEARAGS